ncbi:MAG: CDC27 family protein [Acidobacteriota bacterium]
MIGSSKTFFVWLLFHILFPARAAQAVDCNLAPYECAVELVRRQEFSKAIDSVHELLKQQPTNLKALNLMGIALTALGRVQDANAQFKKALRLSPSFYPALKNLAINELAVNNTAQAKVYFEQAAKLAPEDEVIHLHLAEMAYLEGHCGMALSHFRKAEKGLPSNADSVLHYAECCLKQNLLQEAIQSLDWLRKSDSESHFEAGRMLAQATAYSAAARHFGLARLNYPDPFRAGYNAVLMHLKAGEYAAAIHVGRDLVARGYQRSELLNLVARAYLKNSQVNEALDALRTATQLEPKDEDNYVDIAEICLDYDNTDLGIEVLNIGLEHLPESDRLFLQRGIMKGIKGQLAEAEKDFERAAGLAQHKPLPSIVLGITWLETGRAQEAADLLRDKAARHPEDFLLHYYLGEALQRLGGEEIHESQKAFETSVRLNPNFASSRGQLGKLLLRQGHIHKAIDQLEKAVALDATEVAPLYQLAQAYRKLGDEERADELADRVNKLHGQRRESDSMKVIRRVVKQNVVELSKN